MVSEVKNKFNFSIQIHHLIGQMFPINNYGLHSIIPRIIHLTSKFIHNIFQLHQTIISKMRVHNLWKQMELNLVYVLNTQVLDRGGGP